MLVIVRLTPSLPVSADEVLTTFPLLTSRFILVEEVKVVLLVPVSKLVDEVPSLAREAASVPRVPSVTAMLAVTPLLVSIATVSPLSVVIFDWLPELPSAFAVLPDPPLKDITISVEPSGLSVLTKGGIEIIEVPSVSWEHFTE